MATATVSDVREVVDTDLSDSDISNALSYAQERNEDVNNAGSQSSTTTKNIERFLAAIHIREALEPSILEDSVGDSSLEYESREIQWLRSQLNEWDPSNTLAKQILRDTDRYTGSAITGSES